MRGVIMEKVKINKVLEIYNQEVSKNVKNKRRVHDFEINKMQNVESIVEMLNNGYVGHLMYNIFLIYEPKCRLVMSLSVKDKVINHYVTRNILEPKLTKYLDPRNVATRKGMGTDYARTMVKDYINKLKQDNEELYVLKMDISKYFYSIDHEILKELLKDKLDSEEYNIISKIIDTTNMEYVNKTIKKYKDKSGIDIPYYEFGKGLPIGNMTSQFLSIFYLYKLDYYIVHDLKLKHYVRYMDDFIIIDKDKEKLKDAKDKITEILEKEYKLRVNKKKTNVSNLKGGVGFLGLTYRLDNNKTIIRIKKSNYEKVKKKVKLNGKLYRKGNLSHQKLFSSIMNYKYSYHFCDNYKILRLIDKDIYGE